jgi:hypothetical protein
MVVADKIKEKQESLNPELIKSDGVLDLSELQEIKENFNSSVFVENANNDNLMLSDTYFKTIFDKLYSDEDISLKTEYRDSEQLFTGTKLDFMIKKCGLNLGKTFLFNYEKKATSLKRKSRQEAVMILWQRQEQVKAQEEQQFNKNVNM